MKFINNSLSFILTCLLWVILISCGDGQQNQTQTTTDVDTGNVAFSVRWGSPPINDTNHSTKAMTDCTESDNLFVAARIYKEDTLLRSGEWECWRHEGVIDEVPVGDNRVIVIEGVRVTGRVREIVYEGTRRGISVRANTTTRVEDIVTRYVGLFYLDTYG